MQLVRPLVHVLGDLGQTVGNLGRLREVGTILVKHGFGGLVRGVPDVDVPPGESTPTTPERVAAVLQELGPTYVKLGQVLSTRPDLVPTEYLAALVRLQDHVAPVPFEAVNAVLCEELGPAWRDMISQFDEGPLACASIAQVHTGILADGTEVVIKVQRPGIPGQIDADLRIMRFLLRRAVDEFPEIRSVDPGGLLDEFDRTLRAELDFLREAENMRRCAANFVHRDYVTVPVVIDRLTRRRVLCMTRLVGIPIRQARAHGHDMERIGRNYLDVVFEMLLSHGFFHGDLHPGNVLVLPDGRLGLIDFGMVGTMTDLMRNQLGTMMFALSRGDHRTIARILYDIAIKDERLEYRRVERQTQEVVGRHFPPGVQLRDIDMGAFVVDLVGRSTRLGARIPVGYMMVLKAVVTAEGLAKSLFNEVDPLEVAEKYLIALASQRMSPEVLQQEVFNALVTMTSVADRLPITLSQLLDDLDEQRLTLGIRMAADPQELAHRERLWNRGTFALCGASLTLAAALALGHGPEPYGIPLVPLGVGAVALGAWIAALATMVRG